MNSWNDDVRNSLYTLVSGGQNSLLSGLTPVVTPVPLDVAKSSGLAVIVDVEVAVSSGLQIVIQSGSPVHVDSGLSTFVDKASLSGLSVLADVEVIVSSGLNVNIQSGATVKVDSGLFVINDSGLRVVIQSGAQVSIQSGQFIITDSGQRVVIQSGAPVKVDSGLSIITSISGNAVTISGETAQMSSGQALYVQISGSIAQISGLAVNIGSGIGILVDKARLSGLYIINSGQGVFVDRAAISGVNIILQSGTTVVSQNEHGSWVNATILAGSSLSNEIDLGKDYAYLNIVAPSMTSAAINIYTSNTSGGTFQAVGDSWSALDGNKNATLTLGMWEYIKIYTSAAQSAETVYVIRGVSY